MSFHVILISLISQFSYDSVIRHCQTNIGFTRSITLMMKFNICVDWNNCYDRHLRISDHEVVINQVSIDGNAQSEVVGNGNL